MFLDCDYSQVCLSIITTCRRTGISPSQWLSRRYGF